MYLQNLTTYRAYWRLLHMIREIYVRTMEARMRQCCMSLLHMHTRDRKVRVFMGFGKIRSELPHPRCSDSRETSGMNLKMDILLFSFFFKEYVGVYKRFAGLYDYPLLVAKVLKNTAPHILTK